MKRIKQSCGLFFRAGDKENRSKGREEKTKLPWGERLRRWLYPAHCALCDGLLSGREKGLCASCRRRVQISCLCFENGFAPFPYRGVYRDAVRRFKYSGRAEYAVFFAEAIVCAAQKSVLPPGYGFPRSWRPDVLVPVPIHRSRFRERGYNQAEELARELGRLLHIPCDTKLVVRIRDTRPQNALTPEQRKENVKHAFAVKKHASIPARVLLVDDIYTTGSTLKELEKVLCGCGAREIYRVCICLAV